METIRNYLEGMFAKLPDSPEVRRAREELLAMMEDKYTELINEGHTHNEAVGRVISEFGNLNEVADSLGISHIVNEKKEESIKGIPIDMQDVEDYLQTGITRSLLKAIGIMCLIICPTPPIMFGEYLGVFSAMMMFLLIAVGVGLIVCGSNLKNKYKGLFTGEFYMDYAATEFVAGYKKQFAQTGAILKAIGIALCVICWMPVAVFDEVFSKFKFLENLGAATLFFMVGFGVLLIVYSSGVNSNIDKLLKLNDITTMAGSYTKQAEQKINPASGSKADYVNSLYWPSITCIYLAYSFLTFRWFSSWLIFPIAGILRKYVVQAIAGYEAAKGSDTISNNYYSRPTENNYTSQNTTQTSATADEKPEHFGENEIEIVDKN